MTKSFMIAKSISQVNKNSTNLLFGLSKGIEVG